MAHDFVRQRWFYAKGYFAFVRTTRWEHSKVIGVKYSVAVGAQGTGLIEVSCEGTGNGKLVRFSIADDDRTRAGHFWDQLGVKHKNGVPSMEAAKHYLSLEYPVKSAIPEDKLKFLSGKSGEIKNWTDHGDKPNNQSRPKAKASTSTPHRTEIADDGWVGEVPELKDRSRTDCACRR